MKMCQLFFRHFAVVDGDCCSPNQNITLSWAYADRRSYHEPVLKKRIVVGPGASAQVSPSIKAALFTGHARVRVTHSDLPSALPISRRGGEECVSVCG